MAGGAIALLAAAALLIATGVVPGSPAGGPADIVVAASLDASPVGEVVVEVAGAVVAPGVYRLPTGSRVGDALKAAGGYGPRVDAARVTQDLNLAAILEDGARVLVPVTATKIIDARTAEPFTSVEDLRTRKLLGQKVFDALRDLVTVR